MTSLPMVILALLLISLASSTREGRAAARERLGRYDRPIWLANAVLWAMLIFWPSGGPG